VDLHTLIFIGRSGCGKGTQAALLRDYIREHDSLKRHILYIETGEKFRQFIRGKSYTEGLSKVVYDSDARQPGFLACFMWGTMLVEELEDNMHLVFDGAPRSLPEAELMTTALEFYNRTKPTVVHLNVNRTWSEKHLLARGRQDDTSIVKITKRLDWFDHDVLPAIEYYRTDPRYKLIEVNGEQPIEAVFKELITLYTDDQA
jgi:adenylate kinase